MKNYTSRATRARKTPDASNLFSNEQAYALVTDAVSQRVRSQLDVDRRARRSLYTSLIGVGLTALIAIGGYFGSIIIESAVRKQFETAQEGFVSRVEFLQRSTSLGVQLTRIDLSSGFTHSEIEPVLREFIVLNEAYAKRSSSSSDIPEGQLDENKDALRPSFDLLIRNLGQGGDFGRIERLLSQAPGYGATSRTAIQTLTQAYGRRVIGAAGAPETWAEGQPSAAAFNIYRKYSELARENGFPEVFLAHEPIIWMIEGRPENAIVDLVADIDDLNELDMENYMNLLGRLATQGFVSQQSAESARIQDRAIAFIEKYKNTSEAVGAVAFAIDQ
ncbi:hypothetical protein [uncultured Tateyamaria sp.]|uniref:hypothetical protein n=1 Tax=uncultured Tateyamaria sp. TaxID=455651 RepID=UPI00262914D8|nr:hypothetical protein [uncultured Tateyamaria sp.]